MTITAEVQAQIDEAVEAATAGLKAKNDQLLAEKKRLQKESSITPEQLSAIEAERDKAQADLAAATKELKTAKKTAEDAAKALQSESAFTTKLLAENGLTDLLTKSGVTNPLNLKAAKAILGSQVQITAEGENRIAKVGDKALDVFIKEWSQSDEGKHFVTAPNNAGGGANGGSSSGGAAKTMTRSQFDAADQGARAAFAKDGGKVIDG